MLFAVEHWDWLAGDRGPYLDVRRAVRAARREERCNAGDHRYQTSQQDRPGLSVLQAYRFALDPTAAQQRALASHCGAARTAFNEGLAQVKRCLDQRDAERSYGV